MNASLETYAASVKFFAAKALFPSALRASAMVEVDFEIEVEV